MSENENKNEPSKEIAMPVEIELRPVKLVEGKFTCPKCDKVIASPIPMNWVGVLRAGRKLEGVSCPACKQALLLSMKQQSMIHIAGAPLPN